MKKQLNHNRPRRKQPQAGSPLPPSAPSKATEAKRKKRAAAIKPPSNRGVERAQNQPRSQDQHRSTAQPFPDVMAMMEEEDAAAAGGGSLIGRTNRSLSAAGTDVMRLMEEDDAAWEKSLTGRTYHPRPLGDTDIETLMAEDAALAASWNLSEQARVSREVRWAWQRYDAILHALRGALSAPTAPVAAFNSHHPRDGAAGEGAVSYVMRLMEEEAAAAIHG